MEKLEKDAARPGGLGDLKMGEPTQGEMAAMPSHEAYHEYNKKHLDSLNTPGEDPEYARHVGQDTEFGYERRYPVRLAPEQDEELLAHLHAMGHHLSRTHGDPDSSTPDDMARDERLATHHQQMAQRHHGEYARKFKLYSGQPIGGHGPGSWDMLEEGHEGVPGMAHPADDRLPRSFAKEEVTPEGHIEAAAHHLRHRDENVKHGTTWSEPAAKMHDIMYREHMEALGEDPDAPSALIQSKAAQVKYEGGPKYPGHTVFHRWDNLSNVRKFEPVLGGVKIKNTLNSPEMGQNVDAQGKPVPAPTPVPTQGPPPAPTAKHAIEATNALLRKHQEEMFAPLEKVEELEKAEALEKKRHSFRNQAATPRPKGFHYIRQPVRMPVAVGGLVRRGKVVGKGETDPAAAAAGKRTTPPTPAEYGEDAARTENRRSSKEVYDRQVRSYRHQKKVHSRKAETPAHPTLPGEAADAARIEARTTVKPEAKPLKPASSLNMKWYRDQQAKLGKR